MKILFVVLGFLLPVVMVFAYSIWLNRRRRSRIADFSDDPENKTVSLLVQRCTALKNSVTADDSTGLDEEIESVLATARSLTNQNLRELSLSRVMAVYVAAGRDEEARALLSEVKDDSNRARFSGELFGNDG